MKVGDKVAYSVQFLKSIGMSHSEMAHARGTVKDFQKIGQNLRLAIIDWNNSDLPEKVNVQNLAKVGLNRQFCNID